MNVHPKVAMGTLGGAISVILVWLVSLAGLYPPTEVCAAFATVCGFITAYITSSPDVNPVNGEKPKTAEQRLKDQLTKK